MENFVVLMEMIFQFMNTPIMTIHLGEFTGSITFMQLMIGLVIADIGIWFIKEIFLS